MRRVSKTKTVTEKVYSRLKKAISRNELLPGQMLSIEALSQDFGVSRTPVREALLMLKQEGLVEGEANRGRGIFVAGLSLRDLQDIFELREAIETFALRAIRKPQFEKYIVHARDRLVEIQDPKDLSAATEAADADLAFHRALVVASDNKRFLDVWDQLSIQLRRFWEDGRSHPERASREVKECLQIIGALESNAIQDAIALLEQHLARTREAVTSWWLSKNNSDE